MPDNPDLEPVEIVLTNSMATDSWSIALPAGIPVQAVIAKLIEMPQLGFRRQDDAGQRIPYRLMWREQERYLQESETLRSAGVAEGNTLVMTHEARAGRAG